MGTRWASRIHQHTVLGRIDRERWSQVEEDLDLVDQLERRLDEMTWPTPPSGTMSAAQPLAQLFAAARSSILHWHEFASRPGAAEEN